MVNMYLFLLVFFVTFSNKALAVDLNIVVTKGITKELKVKNQSLPFPPEITPLTLMQGNGKRLYVVSSGWSFLCTSTDNILNSSPSSPLVLDSQNCQIITKPDIYDSYTPERTNSMVRMKYKNPAVVNQVTEMTKDWKRTYDGLLSLHLVNNQLVGVRHNEHVNHAFPAAWTGEGEYIYQNMVQDVPSVITQGNPPYIDAPYKYKWTTGCRSGFGVPHFDSTGKQVGDNNQYDHCWDSFQNFVSWMQIDYPTGGWLAKPNIRNPEIDSSIHDQGPIIWPQGVLKGEYDGKGNLKNNFRASGFYQPTSFVNDGYIYSFFKAVKWGGYCTGAARAPIDKNGLAGSWKFFNRQRGAFDVSALPGGFTKETMRNFYNQQFDGFSDCIVDEKDTSQPQYFNVAKIRNTPYFMAVEERSYTLEGKWVAGARFSTDLINWTSLQELSSCGATTEGTYSGWACGYFAYPTLLDKNATTNYEIDKEEFYLLGTHATGGEGYELSSMRLSLDIPLSSNISDYEGKMVKGTSASAYLVENGKRRAIPDWDTFLSLGFLGNDLIELTDTIINSFPMGLPIQSVNIKTPTQVPTQKITQVPTQIPTGLPTQKITQVPTQKITLTPTSIKNNCLENKKNGDANCDGLTDVLDYALWYKQFYDGNKGVIFKNNWESDFTGINGNSDGKVDIYDYSYWMSRFNLTK